MEHEQSLHSPNGQGRSQTVLTLPHLPWAAGHSHNTSRARKEQGSYTFKLFFKTCLKTSLKYTGLKICMSSFVLMKSPEVLIAHICSPNSLFFTQQKQNHYLACFTVYLMPLPGNPPVTLQFIHGTEWFPSSQTCSIPDYRNSHKLSLRKPLQELSSLQQEPELALKYRVSI